MLHQLVAGALLALAGLFTTAAHAQANTAGGTLHWSASRPLVLADFQGRPRIGETHAALTSATIVAEVACKGGQFTGHVQAAFDPAVSWWREPATATPRLLRHEQLHFDITEVYARRLRQKLAAVRVPCAQLGSAFERLAQGVYADWEKAEAQYDRDTNHGLLPAPQAQWEAQVQQQLADLAAWADKEA
ncbi:MAG TPA: DUF922 domain-containing protein [Hymenobacter sp.]|uniref:DUF922 domain-containing protein n=1 Tax=Hymenobacter sp. TaxID=1898978 RepID=UPI002D7EDA7F|nr:DUF922 domain-containing protein [Hymenobacter sp.]HET9502917.1 DUF922 domain-containing protein [Hymenobacter sp.]